MIMNNDDEYGEESKIFWFVTTSCGLKKGSHKQFQRTLPFGISCSNSESMYHITRVFVGQNRYVESTKKYIFDFVLNISRNN